MSGFSLFVVTFRATSLTQPEADGGQLDQQKESKAEEKASTTGKKENAEEGHSSTDPTSVAVEEESTAAGLDQSLGNMQTADPTEQAASSSAAEEGTDAVTSSGPSSQKPVTTKEKQPKFKRERTLTETEQIDFLMGEHTLEEFLEAILSYQKIYDDTWSLSADGLTLMVMFSVESGRREEDVLDMLLAHTFGRTPKSQIRVIPLSSYVKGEMVPKLQKEPSVKSTEKHAKFSIGPKVSTEPGALEDDDESLLLPEPEEEAPETSFHKSIKSRIIVKSVIHGIKSNAIFTFDYLMLTIIASMISSVGLLENNSVVLVASMLISPIMGPILAGTFGLVIQDTELRNIGLKSELIGLAVCIVTGFLVGLPTTIIGAKWGSTSAWPTQEMASRGLPRGLYVGVLIAVPSGIGVALSVLSGNHGSLVGVAISASLLPPAVNTGMLWASSFISAIKPPTRQVPLLTENSSMINETTDLSSPFTDANGTCLPLIENAYEPYYTCDMAGETAYLGLVSLTLTIINIVCIVVSATILLRIKEVSSRVSTKEQVDFWRKHVPVSKEYTRTQKQNMSNLGKELKKLQSSEKAMARWEKISKELNNDGVYKTVLLASSRGSVAPYQPIPEDFGLKLKIDGLSSVNSSHTFHPGDSLVCRRNKSGDSTKNPRHRLQLMRQISADAYLQKSEFKKKFEIKGRFTVVPEESKSSEKKN